MWRENTREPAPSTRAKFEKRIKEQEKTREIDTIPSWKSHSRCFDAKPELYFCEAWKYALKKTKLFLTSFDLFYEK